MNEREIFDAALSLTDPDAQAAYLERVCGADAGLRRRLEELLDAQRRLGNFLDAPHLDAASPTLDQPALERPGAQIGPYRLLQEIGQGGMGVVYMAEQHEPVRRKVALKIIKPGMDSRQVVARFEAERQALSLMDHPNIARVLDAGTTDSGRPYFVMELLKGQPITEYCDQQRLTPQQRLELFLPVCQAIQHAHQKGIIHRDVKPSNVLVAEYDGRPTPKVIDFGVAKATSQPLTEKTMFTGFGQIVGTLEYMSPEQARVNQLDIDTRSDIYSLGVLLYELLTGTTPFDKRRLRSAAWDEMLRIIREEEPPKPSTRLSDSQDSLPSVSAQRQIEPAKLTRLVRGELDWIVMKALEKDRSRRYETANGLALDIQRYLNDETVEACPPSAAYRFRKFAGRNKRALATAGLVTVALVVGQVGTTWQAIRATTAEGQARESAKIESTLRKRAEAAALSERKAREAESEQRKAAEAAKTQAAEEAAVAKAVTHFLQNDLLGLAGADAQFDARLTPDPNLKLATLLDRALAKVDESFTDQPRVRADIQFTLAKALHAIGRYKEAAQLNEQVRQYFESTLGSEHLFTLTSMQQLALQHRVLGKYSEATSLLERCLESRRRLQGNEHPHTLRALRALADAYLLQAQYAKTEPLYEQCLADSRRVLGLEHPDTLSAMNSLATLYSKQARYAEAETLYRQCLDIRRRKLVPEHPSTLDVMDNLAVVHMKQFRLGEAESLLKQCVEIRRRDQGAEHPHTIESMGNLAEICLRQARYAEAETLMTQCFEIAQRTLGPDAPTTLDCMSSLVRLYNERGRYAEAEPIAVQCLDASRRVYGVEHPRTFEAMSDLASLYRNQGRYSEAGALYTKCLEYRRRALGSEHPDTLLSMGGLAMVFHSQAEYAEAEPLAEQRLEVSRRVLGPEHTMTLEAMHNLVALHLDQRKLPAAEPLAIQCLDITRRVMGSEHPDTLNAMNSLACLYAKQERFAEAAAILSQLLDLSRRINGKEHPETLKFMANLAQTYKRQSRFADAEPLLTECLELSRRVLGPEHDETLRVMNDLAGHYWQQDKLAQSIPLFEEVFRLRAKSLDEKHPDAVIARANLGVNYKDAGRLTESLPLLESAYMASRENPQFSWVSEQLEDAYQKSGKLAEAAKLVKVRFSKERANLPKESPQLAGALAQTGLTLLNLHDWAEAETVLRECLALREKASPDDWRTFNTQSMLGGALLGQKQFDQSEPLLLAGWKGMQAQEAHIPVEGKPRLAEALERLVRLYTEWEKPEQAAEWKAQLDQRRTAADKPAAAK